MGGKLCCEPGRFDSHYAERVRGEWFCQGAKCFGTERCPEVYQAEEIHVEAIFSVSVAVDGLLVFAFVLMYRLLALFCSNPDALGVDNSEKDIFDSLKNITQLPPSPSKDVDRPEDSVIRMAGSPAIEEVGKKSPVAGIGE